VIACTSIRIQLLHAIGDVQYKRFFIIRNPSLVYTDIATGIKKIYPCIFLTQSFESLPIDRYNIISI